MRLTAHSVSELWEMSHHPSLERDNDGRPKYVHMTDCTKQCNCRCNPDYGSNIAEDIEAMELALAEVIISMEGLFNAQSVGAHAL